MKEIASHLATVDGYSVVTALVSLIAILLVSRYAPKFPGLLVGLVAATLVAIIFFDDQVATIRSAYGAISNELPGLRIPEITLERIQQLLYPAFIIAMLGGIESLLSAVVADGMTGGRHNSNRELIGQGIANIVTPLFGGIPATGAIARTAANIKSGASSPLSGVIHSLVVLLVLVLLAPVASRVPLAGMAPVLMVVAWRMSEYKAFMRMLKTRTGDSLVLVITFLLTVLANLTLAVQVGLVLAIVLFIKKMSESMIVAKVLPDITGKHHGKVVSHAVTDSHDCPQIRMITVEGALFFGAAEAFERALHEAVDHIQHIMVLRMSKVPFIDMTGESNLAEVVKSFTGRGGTVIISGIQPQSKEMLERTGLADVIGQENFFAHTGDALNYALTRLNTRACIGCKHYAFRECAALSKPVAVVHQELAYRLKG